MFLSKVREINDRLPEKAKSIQQNAFKTALINKLTSASPATNSATTVARYLTPIIPWALEHLPSTGESIEPKQAMAENTAKQNFPEEITKVVKQVASEFNIDPALIMAVIKAESGFNSRAVSSAGAMGLMQLMPFTAKTLGVSDPFDIWQNIRGGSRYLKDMLDRFGSIPLALAAYNAGPGSVEKYNGIPPYAETQNYVAKVLKYMESYKVEQASLIT